MELGPRFAPKMVTISPGATLLAAKLAPLTIPFGAIDTNPGLMVKLNGFVAVAFALSVIWIVKA